MAEFEYWYWYKYLDPLYQELIQSNNYDSPHSRPAIKEIARVRQTPEYALLRRSLERWYMLRFKSKKFMLPSMGLGDIKITWYALRTRKGSLASRQDFYVSIRDFIQKVYKTYGADEVALRLNVEGHYPFIAIFDSMQLPTHKVSET